MEGWWGSGAGTLTQWATSRHCWVARPFLILSKSIILLLSPYQYLLGNQLFLKMLSRHLSSILSLKEVWKVEFILKNNCLEGSCWWNGHLWRCILHFLWEVGIGELRSGDEINPVPVMITQDPAQLYKLCI